MRDRYFDRTAARNRREELGLSKHKLARLADVSVSYIRALENGTGPASSNNWPSDRIAAVIADTLGCTVDDISYPKSGSRASSEAA